MNLSRKLKRFQYLADLVFLIIIASLYIQYNQHTSHHIELYTLGNETFEEVIDFEGFDSVNGLDKPIIPNIIHFMIRNQTNLELNHLASILSVYKYQKPNLIFIHARELNINSEIQESIKKIGLDKIIKIKLYDIKTTTIFNSSVKFKDHLDDIRRLEILMHYGGIFLDEYTILAQSLDRFRHYEAVLTLDENNMLNNQVMIVHKNSRILKSFYDGYR